MKVFNTVLIFIFSIVIIGCSGNGENKIIKATGTIEATNITVSSKSNGQIFSVLKNEGDIVNKGDTLLLIDHEALELQYLQALAQEEIAAAQYKLSEKGARSEDIIQAEENLKQSEANFNSANADLERTRNLFNTGSVTKKQIEDAETRYKITSAQFLAVKESLKKIRNITRPEEIKQAKANYNKAKASADLIKKYISDCIVISPINGTIVKKFVEAGETVSPMSSLLKISDLKTVKLIIYLSALELPLIKIGDEVTVKIDAFENKSYQGKISYISQEAEFTPKNIQTKDERTKQVFAVKVEIPNTTSELKPGLPAEAEINLK